MGNKVVILSVALICLHVNIGNSWTDGALGGTKTKPVIPPSALSGTDRDRIIEIIEDYTIYKSIEDARFQTNRLVYEYLVDRLPLASDVVRALKIRNLVITKDEGQYFHLKDGKRITGDFRLVHGDSGTRIFYGSGQYRGSVIKRLRGEAVVIVKYREDHSGESVVNAVYLHVKAKNRFFELIIKIFKPLVNVSIDRKMSTYMSAARQVCEKVVEDPEGVYEGMRDSKEVDKDALDEFRRFFYQTIERRE